MSKRLFRDRIQMIAEKLNIEQVRVNHLVNAYFTLCRKDLLGGRVVYLQDFVILKPNVVKDEFIKTTALYCKEVAQTEGATYHTVREIMRAYFDSCYTDLLHGNSVTFRTLATLTPKIVDKKVVTIHSTLSSTINEELQNQSSSDVVSIRSHQNKLFRQQLEQKNNSEVVAL